MIIDYVYLQTGQDCGGGYIKLLSQSNELDLNKFNDKVSTYLNVSNASVYFTVGVTFLLTLIIMCIQTPYTIMFGPDRCGSDSKLHFIFRHVNPKNKTIEEKHCKKLDTKERAVFEELFKDNRPHLFRLVINPDNSFEISVDNKVTFE